MGRRRERKTKKKEKKEWNPKSAATASGLRDAPSVALIEKGPPSMKSKTRLHICNSAKTIYTRLACPSRSRNTPPL